MRATRQMNITLPLSMVAIIKSKVNSGEYASESEVLRDGVRALLSRDKAIEDWLRNDVAITHDEIKSGKGKTLSLDEARKSLVALRGE